MFIFDSHMHAGPHHDPSFPEGVTETAEGHLEAMAKAGVAAAVLVHSNKNMPPYWPGYEAAKANEYPDRFACVYALHPQRADAAEDLARWVHEHGIQGIRLFNVFASRNRDDDIHADDPEGLAMIRAAHALGLSTSIQSGAETLSHVGEAARQCPEARIVIDHFGLATAPEQLLPFAGLPNVALKFSSGALLSRHAGDKAAAVDFGRRMLKVLVPAFGAERLIWGTNYPQTEVPLTTMVEMGEAMMDFLPAAERALVFGLNALRYWRPAGLAGG